MNGGVDGFGVQGLYLCIGSMITLSGSAALLFFYFWRKGLLGMDEEAKHKMMNEDYDDKPQ